MSIKFTEISINLQSMTHKKSQHLKENYLSQIKVLNFKMPFQDTVLDRSYLAVENNGGWSGGVLQQGNDQVEAATVGGGILIQGNADGLNLVHLK